MPFYKQHRFDAAFLVLSRNQNEQAWVGHVDSATEMAGAGNLGKWGKEIDRLIPH